MADEPEVTATTVNNPVTGARLLRITCSEHGILSETTWSEEELDEVWGRPSPMQAYLEHVVGAHREPYGANCTGDVNVNLFDGDRAPVTLVWMIPEYKEFPNRLVGVFATPEDAEQWIEAQREPNMRFAADDHNVLHYLPEPVPVEEVVEP